MKLLTVDTVDGAMNKLIDRFGSIEWHTETVTLDDAKGRYLAEDVYADMDVPGFDRAVVDGYGVIASDTFGVSDSVPVFLSVTGAVDMGKDYTAVIKPGEAVYVPTGGILPPGADSVVMVEYTELLDDRTIAVYKPAAPGMGVMYAGDDVKSGAVVLSKGTRIAAKDIGVLAATGNYTPIVFKRPTVTVISTGDELVMPDKKPGPGQVRDINGYVLAAMCRDIGAQVAAVSLVNDDFDSFVSAVAAGVETSDIVLISGSSSAGEKDMTVKVLEHMEQDGVFVHGLAVKPGKPTILASVNGKPVFGLPGHPVSAYVVFHRLAEPFVEQVYFKSKPGKPYVYAEMDTNVHSGQGRETIQFVSLCENLDAGLTATPVFAKSGAISQLSKADGYVVIPSLKEGIRLGEQVRVTLFGHNIGF